MLALAFASDAGAETFRVTSAADDGSAGTLRWAIERSNAAPHSERHRIEIVADASGKPLAIKLAGLLPPLKGPVVLAGVGKSDERSEPGISGRLPASAPAILDGSTLVDMATTASCPSEDGKGHGPNVRSFQKPALAVIDSGGVEVSGLEIRNFCIGILLLRSRDNHIHHNIIHDMVGAAGILITGDAGDAGGGVTEGRSVDNLVEYNVIYDTGDGAECTRGSSRLTFRHNLFYQSSPNTVSPRSQGVECANTGNDDIRFIGNVFRG
jgi:3-dehydroshikimate dehydratase